MAEYVSKFKSISVEEKLEFLKSAEMLVDLEIRLINIFLEMIKREKEYLKHVR